MTHRKWGILCNGGYLGRDIHEDRWRSDLPRNKAPLFDDQEEALVYLQEAVKETGLIFGAVLVKVPITVREVRENPIFLQT